MTCYELLRSLSSVPSQGNQRGVYSVCSTHPTVLDAALLRACRGESVVIETTANQVNQLGGYTGMTARDFIRQTSERARRLEVPSASIVFGSDHAGPFPWRAEVASQAMKKARDLITDAVREGAVKIHLDASMHLADDPGDRTQPLDARVAAERSADLCQAAEEAWKERCARAREAPAPLYVIGTDVPAPGGTESGVAAPVVTTPDELRSSVEMCRKAFLARGLAEAWDRVIAVVVQPAVEHGERTVHRYHRGKVRSLVDARRQEHRVTVFEAHATDYQTAGALRQMVEDGFAILKVGPSLTGAVREALFLMERVEQELSALRPTLRPSKVSEELEAAMLENPAHWRAYYRGDGATLAFLRKYGLSDRCRYYWGVPRVSAAVARLLDNVQSVEIPLALLNQFFPRQAVRIQEGSLAPTPEAIIRAQVDEVLDRYAAAVAR